MWPSPYILELETNKGPLRISSRFCNRSRTVLLRTTPLPLPRTWSTKPSIAQPKATLNCNFLTDKKHHPRRTRVALCQLSSFRFSVLRCARSCQHFYSFVVVPALFRFVRNRHLFAAIGTGGQCGA